MSYAKATAPLSSKGKERETFAKDYDLELADLNPTITYRHLLSSVPNIRNPLRVVALCDMDAFYASCERVRLGLDPEIPLVVQQWESLIAVNYPARKFGITRMAKIKDALKLCPHLKVVHTATYKDGETEPVYRDNPDTTNYKVSLDYYRSESAKIVSLFKGAVLTGEVEKASVDECFFDFTVPVKEEILRQYPELAQVPHNAPKGLDTPLPPPPLTIPLKDFATVVPIHLDPPPDPDPDPDPTISEELEQAPPQPQPPEEPQQDDDYTTKTWHDVALSIAAKMMQDVRDRVKIELGYTTSAGLARNKFLAKLVASYKKHDSQTILRNDAILEYLKSMPFQKIRFLGGKLGVELAREFDVATVGDLLPISLDEMQSKFGEGSIWVYEILRGVDRSEVKEKGPINKSMLSSKNLPKPLLKFSEGHHWLVMFSAELAHRLINARVETPGLWPKTLSLHIQEGWKTSRSKQAPFPFVRDLTGDAICTVADKLWKELLGGQDPPKSMKITHIGLTFHGIETIGTGQQNIHGFLQVPSHTKEAELTTPERPTSGAKRKRDDGSGTPSVSRSPSVVPGQTGKDSTSWRCLKCKELITVDDILGSDGVDSAEELKRLRTIHEDGHFAETLARQFNGSIGTVTPSPAIKVPSKTKKAKKQAPPEGLHKFFTQK